MPNSGVGDISHQGQRSLRHMKYLVLLEKHDGVYTATVPALPGCRSQGVTEEEALQNVQAVIAELLSRVTVATVEVEAPPKGLSLHTWARFAGMWKDDPSFDDFLAQIEENRRGLDGENPSG
jgi:predicted RNase H-like HicB family nuclease